MKVCAHMIGNGYMTASFGRFDSIATALDYFKSEIVRREYSGWSFGDFKINQEVVIDLYPQCNDCTDNECHHDYPMSRYEVGKRGGLVKVIV